MARNRRSRNRRRKPRHWPWYLAIAACVLLIGAILVASQMLIERSRINETTLCPSRGLSNATAILLDLTDPLNMTQQARLRSIIDRLIEESSTNTMIALGVVSEDPSRWGSMFAKCRPAKGEDASQLYENPTLIAQRYRQEFREPIDRLLDGLLQGDSENRSPIMEALQSLIAGIKEFTQLDSRRKVVIVSDMLQHSDSLSFYRGQGWDYFAQEQGELRLAKSLTGVEVEIWRIPRGGANVPDNALVEDFWVRYFDRQGSRPPDVKSLGDL